jgi:DNA-binding XRE family transcriptional regulator
MVMEAKTHNWNKKVAAKRGPKWHKSLLMGRLQAQMNPTAIRLRRVKKNKTQVEIAKKVGLSTSTYTAIETGRRPAKEESAKLITSVLDIPFDQAFTPSKICKNRFEAAR